MTKFSYKNRLTIILMSIIILMFIIFFNFLSSTQSSNISIVSKNNFKIKALEREEYLNDFLKVYLSTIKSIKNDKNFMEYLSGNMNRSFIENYFLTIKKSLPSLTQVRFLDNDAKEIIKITGNSISFFKDKAVSKIVPKDKLQDKAHRDYILTFMSLPENIIGFSKIDLNMENKKIVIPKEPTLRLGMTVYDNEKNKKGMIILNISLQTFFENILKTTLYDVYLIDNRGNFLLHSSNKYGLLGDNSNYFIKNEFPKEWEVILSNDEFKGRGFFSQKLKNFQNEQEVKIILKLKFNDELNDREDNEKLLILYFFIFVIILIWLINYFTALPDKLRDEITKSKFSNSLTGLPNRLALNEDLNSKKFEDSIVILVSINNLIKIQNSYGQKISSKLAKRMALFLQEYENSNILNIYALNYNLFAIRYKFTEQKVLNSFLNSFLKNIENKKFKIEEDLEFLFDVTIGCSDPNSLHNNIDELREAENALANASLKHQNINIFNSNNNNVKEQKENILLSKELKEAIESDNIFLEFQPIYNNIKDVIDKYECLIRMKTSKEVVYPDKFLPIAKEIKKYEQLSIIVVDKAIEAFKDNDLEFSINISILDILNEEFTSHLIKKINQYNIGSRLVLEIVEQESVDNYERLYEFLKTVKTLGCKIAIDDFGSGYSNFEHIIKMSDYIDYLKLDGSLVKNIMDDEKFLALVQSIIFLCSKLRIKIIAEYVDNKKAQEFLQLLGIDYSQGFYIGKPNKKLVNYSQNS